MGAALLKWIHDSSMDQQFVDHWNKASIPARLALLREARRDHIHCHKAWEFVPQDVRSDVSRLIENHSKSQQKAEPSPIKTQSEHREMWYDKF